MGVKFPKPMTARSEKYLAFVRSLPCCICGSPYTVAHHAGTDRGMGLKCSDLHTVSLCTHCHVDVHQQGVATFCAVHRVEDMWELIAKTMEKYIMETDLCSL